MIEIFCPHKKLSSSNQEADTKKPVEKPTTTQTIIHYRTKTYTNESFNHYSISMIEKKMEESKSSTRRTPEKHAPELKQHKLKAQLSTALISCSSTTLNYLRLVSLNTV